MLRVPVSVLVCWLNGGSVEKLAQLIHKGTYVEQLEGEIRRGSLLTQVYLENS